MIYLELKGRLGNQFFRYAYARALQIQRGETDLLVLGLNNMKDKDCNDGWCDSLKDFNVAAYTTSNKRLIYKYGNIIQQLLDSLYFIDMRVFARNDRLKRIIHSRKWLTFLNKFGIVHEAEEFYQIEPIKTKNVIIDGGFQNPAYFNHIRNILIKEFTPKEKLRPENQKLYNIISSTNSICISIRRGDYISVAEFNKVYNVCTKEYFEQAIEIMKQRIENPVFIVFSDEIQWAKDNLLFNATTYFERGDDPLWEKVRLMSACRHFIISNSSFSWMVQYLGQYEHKVVISPSRWNNGYQFPCYLIEKDFIKIKI